jgi:hemolysin-activating ACP:hemolysin acyltransferase
MIKDSLSPEEFGKVLDIRCMTNLNTSAGLLSALQHSAAQGNIELFYSTAKRPIAYIAWAKVTKESLLLMFKTKQMPAYPYEWNEGHFMIVYDIVFSPQWGDKARMDTLDYLFKKRFFAYFRRNKLHVFYRKHNRHFRHLS